MGHSLKNVHFSIVNFLEKKFQIEAKKNIFYILYFFELMMINIWTSIFPLVKNILLKLHFILRTPSSFLVGVVVYQIMIEINRMTLWY